MGLEGVGSSRAEDPAGFAARLNALRLHRGLSYEGMDAAAKALPSWRDGMLWARLAKSTVGDIVTGRQLPSRMQLLTFLAVCDVPPAEVPLWLAAWDRARTAATRRPPGATAVRDARPRELGVHAAIQVPGPSAPADELPAYVPRDVDARLRAALAAGRFVLLLGESSVGKTRTAWEAVRAEWPDWWLARPADAGELAALADDPTARTVVWLDEFQHFLHDGLKPKVIQKLRNRPDTLLIGTLWPKYYAEFTVLPGGQEADSVSREREVLKLAEIIDLPGRLTSAERERADAAARLDPRICTALASGDYGMTQVLAAAPLLVRRWEQAPTPYARALITAAVDARRLGVEGGIPPALLKAAVPVYLAPSQIAEAPEDWFGPAAQYATGKLHGAAAALSPLPGPEMGTVSGYTVADYLFQQGTAERRGIVPAARVWQAFADHLTGADLWRTGRAAEDRGLLRYAELIYRRAAPALPEARTSLIGLMEWQGRLRDEEEARWAAATADDFLERIRLSNFLDQHGRYDEAESVAREAVARGDTHALSSLADLLDRHGRTAEALDVWREAVAASTREWFPFVEFLEKHRLREERVQALRDGAAAGDLSCRNALERMLDLGGRTAEAEQMLWRSASAGHRYARSILATRLQYKGRTAEAEHLWHQILLYGDGDEDTYGAGRSSAARARLSELLVAQDRLAEAEQLWRDGVRAQDGDAYDGLAKVLELRGSTDEAIAVLLPPARGGDTNRLNTLTILLDRHGRLAEEERILREVSTAYDTGTGWLASLLQKQGRAAEAEAILLHSALHGSEQKGTSRSRLVELLQEDGRTDEAENLLRTAAATGSWAEGEELVSFLEAHGRADESETVWRHLADHGDSSTRWIALQHLVKLLRATGRTAEIETLWRRNLAAGGGRETLDQLIDLLNGHGRRAEASRLRAEGVAPPE